MKFIDLNRSPIFADIRHYKWLETINSDVDSIISFGFSMKSCKSKTKPEFEPIVLIDILEASHIKTVEIENASVDNANEFLSNLQRDYPDYFVSKLVEIRQGDMRNIKLPKETYDLVFCANVLCYLEDDAELGFANMVSLTRRNGYIATQTYKYDEADPKENIDIDDLTSGFEDIKDITSIYLSAEESDIGDIQLRIFQRTS